MVPLERARRPRYIAAHKLVLCLLVIEICIKQLTIKLFISRKLSIEGQIFSEKPSVTSVNTFF